jgi:hypothetical protein
MKEVRRRSVISGWTTGLARRSRLAAISAALAVLAACGSADSPSGPGTPTVPTSPIGSYTIQTVNGKALPVVIAGDGQFTWEVTAGSVVLGADGKYQFVKNYRQTVPGNVSMFVDSSAAGMWVQTGPTIQFTDAFDGSIDSATWDKGIMTFAEPGSPAPTTYVYALKR